VWRARFRQIVLLAAALHDLGKANSHFQEMVRRQRIKQGLRHEWATILIVHGDKWQNWLTPALADSADWPIALWAISGHHPAYNRPSPPQEVAAGAGSDITLFLGHSDFKASLTWLKDTFQLSAEPEDTDHNWPLAGIHTAFTNLRRAHLEGTGLWETFPQEARRLVAAAKSCLIAGDIAGSALPKAGLSPEGRGDWIRSAFANVPQPEQIRKIVTDRLGADQLRPFQEEVAASTSRVTLVRAGCGTGKTLAAYQWAATRCPGRRLYVCYPTTGTATEGYRDYLFSPEEHFSKFGADLFHGRADVDLDIILGVTGDDDRDDAEAVLRFDSLEAWSTPIVSCTVDTVLGLVQNNRRGLYAWPALAGAAFVFDEIHAYDDKLFGALLRFLQGMRGVPVLLMTASLPRGKRQGLEQSLRSQGEELPEIAGPVELERLRRYQRLIAANPQDPLAEVRTEIERGGKVLWVCNTVDRVIQAAHRAREMQPMIYHSRFRYEDRVHRHAAVVNRFKPESNPGAALAICSQVAELSLDLSATLLVNDLSPVPAAIQRLGRLNRRARPALPGESSPPPMPFLVVEPVGKDGSSFTLPYTADDFQLGRTWLEALGPGPLSQEDLAQRWQAVDASERSLPVHSAWLDGGPTTQVRELRQASPGITIILKSDEPALRRGEKRLVQVALPMPQAPKFLQWQKWGRYKGVPIAPAETVVYDPERGAQWKT
jgi:CRISPR-associated endonuclease/helicase Cas3